METRLLKGNVVKLSALLAKYKHRKKIKLGKLQSILGHLNFACKVVQPVGCFFTSVMRLDLWNLYPNQYVKLNLEVRAEMAVWSSFLNHYNGQTLLTNDKLVSSNSLQLYTYLAQSKGFACIVQQVWSYGLFF